MKLTVKTPSTTPSREQQYARKRNFGLFVLRGWVKVLKNFKSLMSAEAYNGLQGAVKGAIKDLEERYEMPKGWRGSSKG